jgi:hypothetical protein
MLSIEGMIMPGMVLEYKVRLNAKTEVRQDLPKHLQHPLRADQAAQTGPMRLASIVDNMLIIRRPRLVLGKT